MFDGKMGRLRKRHVIAPKELQLPVARLLVMIKVIIKTYRLVIEPTRQLGNVPLLADLEELKIQNQQTGITIEYGP